MQTTSLKSLTEVASQIGVSADNLGDWLSQFAPSWTSMRVAESTPFIVLSAVLLLIGLAGLAVALRRRARCLRAGQDARASSCSDAAVVFGLVCLFAMVMLAWLVSGLAPYVASPEAAALRDLMSCGR